MNIIEFLEKAKQTHDDWATYYRKNHGSETFPENINAGDLAHQELCVKEYDKIIEQIKQLQADNKTKAEAVVEFCKEITMAMEAVEAGGKIKINHWPERAKTIREMFEVINEKTTETSKSEGEEKSDLI